MRKVYGLDNKGLFLLELICLSLLCAEAANASSSTPPSGMTISNAQGALSQMSTFMKQHVWAMGGASAAVSGVLLSAFSASMKTILRVGVILFMGTFMIAMF